MPEYTKASQRAARADQYEQELAETKRQLEDFQTKQKAAAIPEDRQQAKRAARELGLADEDYLKEQGFIRKTDLDEYFDKKQNQQQLVDNVIKNANKLEKEIDGSDGRIPFDQKAVLAYASAYNINDLTDAYDQMNARGNAKWKEAQIDREAKPGLTTLRPGGVKTPKTEKVTDDNFKQRWDELYGNNE